MQFATGAKPIHHFDGKGNKSKLKSNKNYLTRVQIILLVIYGLRGGHTRTDTHTHTHTQHITRIPFIGNVVKKISYYNETHQMSNTYALSQPLYENTPMHFLGFSIHILNGILSS